MRTFGRAIRPQPGHEGRGPHGPHGFFVYLHRERVGRKQALAAIVEALEEVNRPVALEHAVGVEAGRLELAVHVRVKTKPPNGVRSIQRRSTWKPSCGRVRR